MFAKNRINLVETRVGSETPIDAIGEEVAANPGYAGFVISTLPQEPSRWIRMDLLAAVESHPRARHLAHVPNGMSSSQSVSQSALLRLLAEKASVTRASPRETPGRYEPCASFRGRPRGASGSGPEAPRAGRIG